MKGRFPTVAVAALVAAAVAVAAVLAGGAGSSTLDPLARAAQKTIATSGAHMSISGTVTVPGTGPITLSGLGAFNFKGREGQLHMAVSGLPAQAASTLGGTSVSVDEVMKGNSVYVGSSMFDGSLPDGARWLRIDLARMEQAVGVNPASLANGSSDPAALVEFLKHAGGAHAVGHELVRGVDTTHYTGTLDLQRALESHLSGHAASEVGKVLSSAGLRAIPVGVWVDGQGRVRRMVLSIGVEVAGQRVGATVQCEFFGFGSVPAVAAPKASEVFDGTAQALSPLSGGG